MIKKRTNVCDKCEHEDGTTTIKREYISHGLFNNMRVLCDKCYSDKLFLEDLFPAHCKGVNAKLS